MESYDNGKTVVKEYKKHRTVTLAIDLQDAHIVAFDITRHMLCAPTVVFI